MSLLGTLGNGLIHSAEGFANTLAPGASLLGLAPDVTPGFSATNVAKTQLYNATGQQVPGYNTTSAQLAASRNNTPVNNNHPLVQGDSTTTPNNTGNTGGTVYGNGQNGTTLDPAYGLYAGQAQSALQRALGAYNTTQDATNQQYNTNQNELNSALAKNKADYTNNLTQQDQTRLTNDNQIRNNANQGYQSLLRMLGGMGAGGGSEAQYLVPQLVGQQLSQQLGGSDQTAAQNKQAITSTYNNYLGNEANSQKKLNDWKTGQLTNAQAAYNSTTGRLNSLLAALNSHADTATNLGSQVSNVDAQIPNQIVAPQTYDGVTPVYQAPQLSTFESKAAPAAQLQANTPGGNTPTTYLNTLLGLDQKKQANVA